MNNIINVTEEIERGIAKRKQWETLWGIYIEKHQRLDELKGLGRYGYQLRMPKRAIAIAAENLRAWCLANGETFVG